jgi:hypothetical protein
MNSLAPPPAAGAGAALAVPPEAPLPMPVQDFRAAPAGGPARRLSPLSPLAGPPPSP